MGGYNSTIFAYGQTGAGKTYTMQGPLVTALPEGSDEVGDSSKGFCTAASCSSRIVEQERIQQPMMVSRAEKATSATFVRVIVACIVPTRVQLPVEASNWSWPA